MQEGVIAEEDAASEQSVLREGEGEDTQLKNKSLLGKIKRSLFRSGSKKSITHSKKEEEEIKALVAACRSPCAAPGPSTSSHRVLETSALPTSLPRLHSLLIDAVHSLTCGRWAAGGWANQNPEHAKRGRSVLSQLVRRPCLCVGCAMRSAEMGCAWSRCGSWGALCSEDRTS
eukprot:3864738-Rhodomonas_salina.1